MNYWGGGAETNGCCLWPVRVTVTTTLKVPMIPAAL